jgi:hypothetical protein
LASPLIFIWATNLWQCMLAEAFGAAAWGFYNGALDAWLKHELEFRGDNEQLIKATSQGAQAIPISLAFGTLTGGVLARYSLVLPWIVGILFNLVLLAAVIFLVKEHYQPLKTKSYWLDSVSLAKKDKTIKLVCLLGFVNCLICAAPSMYWQPNFISSAADPVILGVLCFGFFAANFLGAKASEKGFAKSKAGFQAKAMIGCLPVIGALIIASAVCPWFYASVLFFAMHECPRGMFYALKQAYLQNAIKEESKRATIGSISSFFEQLGSIAAYLACYFLIQLYSISTVWLFSGAAAVMAFAAIFSRFRKMLSG